MTFTARDDHERAQQRVRLARDAVHAARERRAAGNATNADVDEAVDHLDSELQLLRHVQRELPDHDGATS